MFYYLALAYGDQEKYKESIDCLNEVLKLLRTSEKTLSKVYKAMEFAYNGLNDKEKSLEIYGLAVQKDRSMVEIYYYTGLNFFLT